MARSRDKRGDEDSMYANLPKKRFCILFSHQNKTKILRVILYNNVKHKIITKIAVAIRRIRAKALELD